MINTLSLSLSPSPSLSLSPSPSLPLTDTVYHLIPVFGIVPIVLLLLLGIIVATVLLLVAYIQNKKLKMKSDSFHSPKKALAVSRCTSFV